MTTAAWSQGSSGFFQRGSSNASGMTPWTYLRKTSRPAYHDPLVLAVQTAKRAIERLRNLEANWDGFGSAAPNPDAIKHAARMLPELVRAADGVGDWSLPHVASNEDGEVVLEWWLGAKKLTLFVRPDGVDYLKAWGERIDDEMDDGALEMSAFPELWAWLSI